jgi:hypothetical protein
VIGNSTRRAIFFFFGPTIKSKELALSYKVWLELVDLPPHMWSEQEISITGAQLGVVLAHTPLSSVSSFERLRLCVATTDLSKIPYNVEVFLNRCCFIARVIINGSMRETTTFKSITDTMPAESVYEDRAMDLYEQMEIEKYKHSSANP